jgi:hypothetical protein
LPTCIAAKTLKIPIICHESDYSLGLANKIVSGFATKTLTSFSRDERRNFYRQPPCAKNFSKTLPAKMESPPTRNRQTVMFFGGSLGASAINTVVYNALPELLKNYNVIHICGKYGNTSIKAKDYYQFVYTDKISAPLMKQSDIIVLPRRLEYSLRSRFSRKTLYSRAASVRSLPRRSARQREELPKNAVIAKYYCKMSFASKVYLRKSTQLKAKNRIF